jgi:bacillithiol biosynthesis cysteine-adding enzyme BshC
MLPMPKDCISFRDTNYYSSLICDYLDENEALKQLYNGFPRIENFNDQIIEKKKNYPQLNRAVLASTLEKQYGKIETSDLTKQNISFLRDKNTFTITTGHQLNLFTGPLYFLYKIVSTINLTTELNQKYPKFKFVPMYWMASEDHDFEEINYFTYQDIKLSWNRKSKGAVGRLSTDGLDEVLDVFGKAIGKSPNAMYLKELFQKAYLDHNNLTDATRFLANELFKDYGLIIIDADDKELKQLFEPYLIREIQEKVSFKEVTKTNNKLAALSNNYSIQVNPREINLFYLKDNLRERIIEKEGVYSVNNSETSWSESDLIKEVQNYPERFSPNVLMRPLYQEVILPNLCYIGGGGELAYWMQLKSSFNSFGVSFPILLLRNSALIQSVKQSQKLRKLEIDNHDLFLDKNSFINKKVRSISNIEIDFSTQKETLKKQFDHLYKLAEQTDKSFLGAVSAQERKQIKGLEKLEKRLLKAQKKKLADHVIRLTDLQNELFPNQNLQERVANFSEFYLEYGDQLIPKLIKDLEPLQGEFLVLTL